MSKTDLEAIDAGIDPRLIKPEHITECHPMGGEYAQVRKSIVSEELEPDDLVLLSEKQLAAVRVLAVMAGKVESVKRIDAEAGRRGLITEEQRDASAQELI